MAGWLLTAALDIEAKSLIAQLSAAAPIGGKQCFAGRLGRQVVVLMLTGLGPINAAQGVTAALERLPGLDGVINLGCAGAYSGAGLKIGDAVLASEVVLADLGMRKTNGILPLDNLGIPLYRDAAGKEVYNRIPVDRDLTDRLARIDPNLKQGVFATVGQVSGDHATAAVLELAWGAILEDMESAAVGMVAALYNKPFACLRGVSNMAGHRKLDVAAGAEAAQKVLLSMG
jgi:futalosine hydrolase